MTSQGSARGQVPREIKVRSLFQAEVAVRELRGLALADALELVIGATCRISPTGCLRTASTRRRSGTR